MKRIILIAYVLLLAYPVMAQKNRQEQAVVDEGIRLYESEMASWNGTDLFVARYPDEMDRTGGYFSYAQGDRIICLFYSDETDPDVIATISFDKSFNPKKAKVDKKDRAFTPHETTIYTIRKKALEELRTDTMFKRYEHTNFNLIPLVNGGEKKVYVLTGPTQTGVMLLGNDYLLTFDADNSLTSKQKLHHSLIPFPYDDEESTAETKTPMHTHLPSTGEMLTPTDICTIMLYQDFAKWESHVVVTEKHMCVWTCKSRSMALVPRPGADEFKKD
jgi:hypothetical protein